MISALAVTLDPDRFERHAEASEDGIFRDGARTHTRVVDGACIFLNRPGFVGGAGCALDLAAIDAGESPIDWKPSVCWQLPIKVDWEAGADGTEVATVRRWTRRDWGAEGETMAWCCTEGSLAYVGEHQVIDSLGAELEAIVGTESTSSCATGLWAVSRLITGRVAWAPQAVTRIAPVDPDRVKRQEGTGNVHLIVSGGTERAALGLPSASWRSTCSALWPLLGRASFAYIMHVILPPGY